LKRITYKGAADNTRNDGNGKEHYRRGAETIDMVWTNLIEWAR
jgi:hypothetical protein